MRLLSTLKQEIKELFPAYFALVMATGIISIGAHLLEFPAISDVLFWGNNVAYGMLIILLLIRFLFFTGNFVSDLTLFTKGAGFFTLVAATCILGIQYAQLKHKYAIAKMLFWFGVGVWILLMYAFLAVITTQSEKATLEKEINGLWLLMVVSTQSIAVLGTTLAKHLPFTPEQVMFFTLSAFLLGTMLYTILITLIFYRLIFFPLEAKDFKASYWINLGAGAITTLAGATLMQNLPNAGNLISFIPFVQGVSLLTWIVATWWMPLIIILDIWKYLIKKTPLTYTPQFWSTVFCLGMYTVSTLKLSQSLKMHFIQSIPAVFIYISMGVWALVFLGMLISIIKAFTSDIPERALGK